MTALVTGASGGLGSAIAAALAHAGHDVAVHWRSDRAGAEATAAAVRVARALEEGIYLGHLGRAPGPLQLGQEGGGGEGKVGGHGNWEL